VPAKHGKVPLSLSNNHCKNARMSDESGNMFRSPVAVYEDEMRSVARGPAAARARWLSEQISKREKHRIVLVPDANGGLRGGCRGLGKRLGRIVAVARGRLIERLPARRFRLAQEFPTTDATPVGVGIFLWGVSLRTLPPMQNDVASVDLLERRHGIRGECRRSLRMARDWIQYASRRFGRRSWLPRRVS